MSNQKNMWIDYYMEFADKLLEYKDNRKELINKIKRVFNAIDSVRLPKLDKDGKIYDIDPFTTFGLFNKKLTDENRIKIMTGIKNEFSLNTNVPTNLNGIPVLNPQVSAFYDFIDKREKKGYR